MHFKESGMRIARDLVIGKRQKWDANHKLKEILSHLDHLSKKETKGPLHDRYYMVFREGKAALSSFAHKPRLRHSGKLPFVQWILREYLTMCDGKIDEASLYEFLSGVASEKGLEEAELALLRPILASLLISRIEADPNAPNGYESIRLLGRISFSSLHERLSPIEQAMTQAAGYSRMNERTRGSYRRKIAQNAQKLNITEWDYTKQLLDTERMKGISVGHQLFPRYGKDRCGIWLLPLISTAGALMISIWFFLYESIWYALAAFPILYECSMRFARLRRESDFLFAMDYHDGIPQEETPLCVVTTLLSKKEDIPMLIHTLEDHALREQRSKNIFFGLLLDLPDGESPVTPEEKSEIRFLREEIQKLNRKYKKSFYAFIRNRRYSSKDKRYLPWERKRGAILSLCALLGGKESELISITGCIPKVKYLITLDCDTISHPEGLRHLVEAAAHPMNQPQVRNNRVTCGYGILAPKLLSNPSDQEETLFATYMAGSYGYSLYDSQTTGIYGKLMGQSPFSGKGLLHIELVNSLLQNRFPENRILSHDIPEGGVLRAGLVGESLCYETTPKTVVSWFKRLDRWTRGDIQNISILNKVSKAGQFFILENIRGAFLPFSILIYLGHIGHGSFLSALPLIVLLLWDIWQVLISLWLHAGEYMPRSITGKSPMYLAWMRSGLRILTLPYEAWVTQKAIWTALWRLLVTGKNRLYWHDNKPVNQTATSYIKRFLPTSLLSGFFIPVLFPVWIWAGSVFFSLSQKENKQEVDPKSRNYLREICSDSMEVMRQLCSPEWGYLPADHIQFFPYKGITKATSPTNIGMTLLAFLSYKDLNLEHAESFLLISRRMLDTLETLPRFRGHFYNWYDLTTLQPTDPKMISSVDSGNLCACLYSFANGMRSLGYEETACKALRLADEMRFDIFYDKDTMHLSVGIQEDGMILDNRYDLYESEARMASYLGCARGELPLSHWNALGRPVMTWKGYAGAASWSGTMFEYLTPHIFLKAPVGSLCREGEAFAVMMQKWHGKRHKQPWGISESCFYGFDPDFSYRYKANGVSGTALAPRRNGEYIIAPYAACMALEYDNSTTNLRKIQSLGGRGTYGFYEALDTSNGQNPVECYMSHHIGMAVSSITNYLCHGVMRDRFSKEASLRAFRVLLWESAPRGPKASEISGEAPPGSLGNGEGAKLFQNIKSETREAVSLLLNGHLVKIYADGRLEDANRPIDHIHLAIRHGDSLISLTPYPDYREKRYTTFFSSKKALFALQEESFSSELLLDFTHQDKPVFTLTLHNQTDAPLLLSLYRIPERQSRQEESISLAPAEIRAISIEWL